MVDTTVRAPGQQDEQAPVRPLWRNVQFQVLWAGQSASTLGIAVADVAYPLAILALTGSAARAGLFAAVQAAGALAAGLPGGHLADRCDWRRIVIAAETSRALVTGGIVAALLLGALSLPVLLIAAALLGTGQAIASSARYLLVRAAVPPSQLTAALTQDEVRQNGAMLIGPPVGGALYAIRALAHATPFLFTAASFVLSLVTALLIRVNQDEPRDAAAGVAATGQSADPAASDTTAAGVPDRTAPADEPSGADPARSSADDQAGSAAGAAAAAPATAGRGRPRLAMLEGLATLWHQPVLRGAMLLIMMVNTVGSGLDIILVVVLRQQAVAPAMIGLALGGGAVGGLAGAPLVPLLHRLRPGVLLLGICLLLVPVVALLAVPAGPWWAAAVLFAGMLGMPAIRVLLDVLVLRQAPADQRGRVIGAVQTLLGIGIPAGLAGSGLLLQFLPATTAVLVLAGLLALSVLSCAMLPALRQSRWPA
ncbi:MAG TPA: MFS transporter [Streptosporangiaceae bacterium]|jgi:MFS family permease